MGSGAIWCKLRSGSQERSGDRSEMQQQQKFPCGLRLLFSRHVRQRMERSGSGKDGLMRRSEGELGSGR